MLFKILHGDASRISTSITPYHEGYCYVTHDGYFYVDMNNERVKLNAQDAETLTGASLSIILNSSDIEIPTSKAVLDALSAKADIVDLPIVKDSSAGTINLTWDGEIGDKDNFAFGTWTYCKQSDMAPAYSSVTSGYTFRSNGMQNTNIVEGVNCYAIGDAVVVTSAGTCSKGGTTFNAPSTGIYFGRMSGWYTEEIKMNCDISYTSLATNDASGTKHKISVDANNLMFVTDMSNNSVACMATTDYVTSQVDALSTTVTNQIAEKQDQLTFDSIPTDDSTNPVTSEGIKSYVNDSIILKDTEIKLPFSSRWLSICYGNGKFVAVGNNIKAACSTDGTTWYETSMPSYQKWMQVVYGEDKFVALSFTKIAYSTDGITWSEVSAPSNTNSYHSWNGLAYGNGVFVITAKTSSGSNPTSDYAYSTDGINWTKSNLPMALSYPHIAYGNGKFITCSDGVISSSNIYYSEDGINWNSIRYSSSINSIGICYVGDRFIIETDSSGLENLYSTDGLTWNTMSTGLNTSSYNPSFGYGGGMYIAVTSSSTTDRIQYNGIALYSTDGITWNQTTMPFKCSSDVVYGNGRFVALHNYGESYDVSTDTIMYSDDGISWHSGTPQLQTIGGENATDSMLEALKHTHPEYVTTDEMNEAIAAIPKPDMSQYYTKTEVDAVTVAAIEAAFANIATVEGGSF